VIAATSERDMMSCDVAAQDLLEQRASRNTIGHQPFCRCVSMLAPEEKERERINKWRSPPFEFAACRNFLEIRPEKAYIDSSKVLLTSEDRGDSILSRGRWRTPRRGIGGASKREKDDSFLSRGRRRAHGCGTSRRRTPRKAKSEKQNFLLALGVAANCERDILLGDNVYERACYFCEKPDWCAPRGRACAASSRLRARLPANAPDPLPTHQREEAPHPVALTFTSVAIKVEISLLKSTPSLQPTPQTNLRFSPLSLLLPQTKQKRKKQTTFRPCQECLLRKGAQIEVETELLSS